MVRWLQRGYERMLRPIVRRPARRTSRSASIAVLGIVVVPRLGQALFPEFKERDFLMHWLTKPGTSLAGGAAHHDRRRARSCGRSRACATSAPTSARRSSPTSRRHRLRRELDQHRPEGRLRRDAGEDPGGRRRLSRDVAATCRPTSRNGSARSSTGASEPIVVRIFGHDLDVLRDKADEVKEHAARRSTASTRSTSSSRTRCRRSRSTSTCGGRALRPQAGRRPPRRRDVIAGEEVGDIFRDGKAYDVQVWSTPEARNSLDDIEQPAARHAEGDRCAWTTSPT